VVTVVGTAIDVTAWYLFAADVLQDIQLVEASESPPITDHHVGSRESVEPKSTLLTHYV